jgi:hypothetical protein
LKNAEPEVGVVIKSQWACVLQRKSQKSVFRPDGIQLLATAYENALPVVELNDRDDPIPEIIAKGIIEAAQTGLRDPDSLNGDKGPQSSTTWKERIAVPCA